MTTTIQIAVERKDRLLRLKVGSMTYDDVIDQLLREVDEEAFRQAALRWQEDLAGRIRADTRNTRLL